MNGNTPESGGSLLSSMFEAYLASAYSALSEIETPILDRLSSILSEEKSRTFQLPVVNISNRMSALPKIQDLASEKSQTSSKASYEGARLLIGLANEVNLILDSELSCLSTNLEHLEYNLTLKAKASECLKELERTMNKFNNEQLKQNDQMTCRAILQQGINEASAHVAELVRIFKEFLENPLRVSFANQTLYQSLDERALKVFESGSAAFRFETIEKAKGVSDHLVYHKKRVLNAKNSLMSMLPAESPNVVLTSAAKHVKEMRFMIEDFFDFYSKNSREIHQVSIGIYEFRKASLLLLFQRFIKSGRVYWQLLSEIKTILFLKFLRKDFSNEITQTVNEVMAHIENIRFPDETGKGLSIVKESQSILKSLKKAANKGKRKAEEISFSFELLKGKMAKAKAKAKEKLKELLISLKTSKFVLELAEKLLKSGELLSRLLKLADAKLNEVVSFLKNKHIDKMQSKIELKYLLKEEKEAIKESFLELNAIHLQILSEFEAVEAARPFVSKILPLKNLIQDMLLNCETSIRKCQRAKELVLFLLSPATSREKPKVSVEQLLENPIKKPKSLFKENEHSAPSFSGLIVGEFKTETTFEKPLKTVKFARFHKKKLHKSQGSQNKFSFHAPDSRLLIFNASPSQKETEEAETGPNRVDGTQEKERKEEGQEKEFEEAVLYTTINPSAEKEKATQSNHFEGAKDFPLLSGQGSSENQMVFYQEAQNQREIEDSGTHNSFREKQTEAVAPELNGEWSEGDDDDGDVVSDSDLEHAVLLNKSQPSNNPKENSVDKIEMVKTEEKKSNGSPADSPKFVEEPKRDKEKIRGFDSEEEKDLESPRDEEKPSETIKEEGEARAAEEGEKNRKSISQEESEEENSMEILEETELKKVGRRRSDEVEEEKALMASPTENEGETRIGAGNIIVKQRNISQDTPYAIETFIEELDKTLVIKWEGIPDFVENLLSPIMAEGQSNKEMLKQRGKDGLEPEDMEKLSLTMNGMFNLKILMCILSNFNELNTTAIKRVFDMTRDLFSEGRMSLLGNNSPGTSQNQSTTSNETLKLSTGPAHSSRIVVMHLEAYISGLKSHISEVRNIESKLKEKKGKKGMFLKVSPNIAGFINQRVYLEQTLSGILESLLSLIKRVSAYHLIVRRNYKGAIRLYDLNFLSSLKEYATFMTTAKQTLLLEIQKIEEDFPTKEDVSRQLSSNRRRNSGNQGSIGKQIQGGLGLSRALGQEKEEEMTRLNEVGVNRSAEKSKEVSHMFIMEKEVELIQQFLEFHVNRFFEEIEAFYGVKSLQVFWKLFQNLESIQMSRADHNSKIKEIKMVFEIDRNQHYNRLEYSHNVRIRLLSYPKFKEQLEDAADFVRHLKIKHLFSSCFGIEVLDQVLQEINDYNELVQCFIRIVEFKIQMYESPVKLNPEILQSHMDNLENLQKNQQKFIELTTLFKNYTET